MAATYKGLLTNNGKALIAGATVNNKINYSHIAVGDGNGSVPTPLETRTALVNEKARIALNVVEINPNNTNQIVCEAIIPTNTGGFYIRELGLYADNTMVVNASYPPTYKPMADEGGAREIAIKIFINIQNAEVIALYLDDSLIYATREWVNNNYIRRNELIDNLVTDDSTKALTAKQGKKLQDEKFAKAGGTVAGDITVTGAITVNVGDATNAFKQIIKANTTTDGGYLAVGNTGSDKGYVEIGAIDDADSRVFARKRGELNQILSEATLLGSNDETVFPVSVQSPKLIGALQGNADTASKLQILRTISFSGAATGSFNFDGSSSPGCILTLANSGVTASTYGSNIVIPVITFNAKGLATGVSTQTIRSASTTQNGIVQLNDTLTSSATDQALTAKQGKALQDAKFDKTGGAVAGSVQLTSDNTVLTVGIDRDIGFVKKQGAGGVLAIAKDRIFRIVGGNKAEISADASDTFTDLLSLNGSGVLSTPGGFSGNASSASKLQQQRKINDAYFDGTEDIIITAEQRVNGNIGSEAQLNAALMSGVYICSSENGLAGLYGYGVLQVYRSGNVISQVYFPHQLSGNNENIVALRQTWNGGSSWFGWYYLGQKDSSKLPLAGGALTGLLSSNTDIKTTTWMYAQKFVGADGGNAIFKGNASTSTKLETARNIAITGAVSGSANFDGSGNITITTTANNAIGVGQSWSEVTSSRAVNTTYTNTTGKPIQIMVTTANWNNAGSFELVLDGVPVTSFGNQDGYNQSKPVSAIVPNGSTYRVNGSFTKWSELR